MAAPPHLAHSAAAVRLERLTDVLHRLEAVQGENPAAHRLLREAAADVKQFFTAHPVESAERGIRQAIERVESCAALRARQSEPLGRWLSGPL